MDIAAEVGKVLAGIVESIGKTTDLVTEIAAASQEPARGPVSAVLGNQVAPPG